MNINTKLDAYEFIAVTDQIAEGYFDDDGKYQPHVGMLNAMRIFSNMCIKNDDGSVRNAQTIGEVNEMVSDSEFCSKFFESIECSGHECLSFAHAYTAAMQIVKDRQSSFARIAKTIQDVVQLVTSSLKPDEINEVIDLSKKLAGDGNYVDNILNAYMESDAYKRTKGDDTAWT